MVIGHVRKSNKGEIKMKNYFNKIIIMFVMALGIIGFNYTSAFAEETNQSIKINNTTLTFDKIIYVDGTNGNDEKGDGSESHPYITLTKALANSNTENSAIFLKGTTKEPSNSINLKNKNITIIGDYLKYGSKITNTMQYGNVNIYDTYLYNDNTAAWAETFSYIGNLNLYNCIFEEKSEYSNVYVTNANYYNCLISKQGILYDPIKFVNCAFSGKTNSNGNLSNVTYDKAFNITSNGWENSGVGTNPDGTKANIGVYGGEFAWENWNLDKETINLDKSTLSLTVGDSKDLIATTTPAAVDIDWSSSDETVATVDSNGNVKAIKEGQSTITAKIKGTDIKSTCIVTVTKKDTVPEPVDPEQEYIINTANAKGENTNNASGSVSIKFNGTAETTLSVVKTADVKEVWVGDTFTYTIVVTNTGSKTAKAVVINDSAPNHIDFIFDRATTTKGKVDESSTSKNIVINVGDIEPSETVTIKIPVNVVA